MDQVGNAIIESTILPFLERIVFKNVEKDKLLQKAVKFGETLTELDKTAIADKYTLQTNTIINTNLEFREVFWKEFFVWIDMQKQLTTDRTELAKRLLPIKPDGGFYDEAVRNFNKFGLQTIKAFGFYKINQKIEEKHGKDSDKAKQEKAKLKKGELILIRNKEGRFDYFAQPDVRRALESVKKSADFLKNLYTEDTTRGTCVISFNPLQTRKEGAPEVKSTILDLNKEIWANKAAIMQKHLEVTVGLYVDGPLTVDNGLAKGNVVDKKGVKLKLEVNIINPEKRVYTFTFVDKQNKPTQSFDLTEDDLQYHFVNKKQTVMEAFTVIQREKEKFKRILPVSRAIAKPREKGEPSATVTAEEKKRSEPIKSQLEGTTPVEPPAPTIITGLALGATTEGPREAKGEKLVSVMLEPPKGPMTAKRDFETRFLKEREEVKDGKFDRKVDSKAMSGDKNTKAKAKAPKNAIFKVAKVYGAAGAGLIGGVTGITLFT